MSILNIPRRKTTLIILIFTALLLASCTQEVETLPRVWIDSPRDGATVDPGQPLLVYSHAYAGTGLAEIVLSVDGVAYKRTSPAQGGDNFSAFQQEWLPPGDGTYIFQLVAYDVDGVRSNPVNLTIRVGTPLVVEPEGESPPEEEVAVAVNECPPVAVVKSNANCRSGPGEVYDVISSFKEGSQIGVQGQSQDGYWWVVDSPGTGGTCWIWEELVTLSNDTCSVAVIDTPPTPQPPQDLTAPPVPSPQVPSNGLSLSCRSYQELVWLPVDDESGIAGYYIRMEKETSPGNWTSVNQWGPIQGKKQQVPVECGLKYRWSVRAEDEAGNFSSWSANSTFIVNLE